MTSSGAARLPITKTGGNKGGWIGQKVWMSCVIWLPASSLCTFAPHPKVRWKRFQRPSHSEKWTDEVFWISLPSCGQLWKFCIVFSLGRAVHTGLTGWQKISGRLQTNELSNSQSWPFGIFHEREHAHRKPSAKIWIENFRSWKYRRVGWGGIMLLVLFLFFLRKHLSVCRLIKSITPTATQLG